MSIEKQKFEVVVVDSSAIIHHQQLYNVAKKIVTIPEVFNELKSQRSQISINIIPEEVNILTPSEISINYIQNFAKKTGDLRSLSIVDVKVLAMVYEMEKQYCNENHIRKDPIVPKIVSKIQEPKAKIPGFYSKKKDEENNDNWITPENIYKLNENNTNENNCLLIKVVCAVSDYAMQNVLLHMGLHIISTNGYFIKNIKSYIMKCTTCHQIESDVTKEFCNNCGYRNLRKVAYTLSSDGAIVCQNYIKSNKKQDISKFSSLKSIDKYGCPISNEEQLKHYKNVHRTKTSKLKINDGFIFDIDYTMNSHSMFNKKDTTSRSFQKGYYLRKHKI